jgi:hypothetical protein
MNLHNPIITFVIKSSLRIFLLFTPLISLAQQPLQLKNDDLTIAWKKTGKGYAVSQLLLTNGAKYIKADQLSGEFSFLYSEKKPDTTVLAHLYGERAKHFPESSYMYIIDTWRDALRPVPMNRAGDAFHFFPGKAETSGDTAIIFTSTTSKAMLRSVWQLDKKYPGDILVTITLRSLATGYFSICSPALRTIKETDLKWGIIPGVLQGSHLEKDLVKSYAYGHGIPDQPVVVRERTVSTLSPILTDKKGISLAVTPQPGTGRDPWQDSVNTHSQWKLGLSLMNREAALSPTLYYPVLGETGSFLNAGDEISFSFRYTVRTGDWYDLYQHAANDIYRFPDFLKLKKTKRSLTDRLLAMQGYLHSDSTSLWRLENYNGDTIGAQAYNGGVVASQRDAMKNSDYGAMWMMATVADDSVLLHQRLPYARNFKLTQQQITQGFFQGAAVGQYYLSKSKHFTEEWGSYVEPIAITYYTLIDIGNILLFEKEDTALFRRLRLGADRLLQWQHPDGHWEVAYDRMTEQRTFTDLKDYRPTFYGLLVAYQLLGDKKYLDGAVRGAEWFIREAVGQGFYLGVCGDLRFVPDFATGQSSAAMLALFEITKDKKYLDVAIEIARFYTTSVYTQPVPSAKIKLVNGRQREDWEIAQAGLSFEHGGTIGSATKQGPILLASHAGLFVRMFSLTKDSLFLNMARAAALGREAFVDSATSVASYYWAAMNKGAGPFPHHAWWQIGWLTDYLLAETSLRTNDCISFPKGFITPKVGPHQSYGFAPGNVFGAKANLVLRKGMLQADDPYIDYFGAVSTDKKEIFFVMLNNDDEERETSIRVDPAIVLDTNKYTITATDILDGNGSRISGADPHGPLKIFIPAYGIRIIKISCEN